MNGCILGLIRLLIRSSFLITFSIFSFMLNNYQGGEEGRWRRVSEGRGGERAKMVGGEREGELRREEEWVSRISLHKAASPFSCQPVKCNTFHCLVSCLFLPVSLSQHAAAQCASLMATLQMPPHCLTFIECLFKCLLQPVIITYLLLLPHFALGARHCRHPISHLKFSTSPASQMNPHLLIISPTKQTSHPTSKLTYF